VRKFIAACNANDVVPRFLQTRYYDPMPSIPTLSNAMDVGSPSNFVRITEIFGDNFADLKAKVEAASISDETTAATMREVYEQHGYILDPHGAVGYRAIADHLENHPDQRGIVLETAHPVKFDSVNEIIGTQGETPSSLKELFSKEKNSIETRNDYGDVKEILLSKI